MLKNNINVRDKISHRMKQHFSHIRSVFSGNVKTRNNSHSGSDGRFSIIYKMFFNESSYIAFRIKEDNLYSANQKIQFYVVRILQQSTYRGSSSKKVISNSRELTVSEFINLMKSMLSIETKESFVRLLNEKQIFSFDLTCCLSSLSDFVKLFMNKESVEEQFKIINEIGDINNSKLKDVNVEIKNISKVLEDDLDYQELLRQREEIEKKIKEKELSVKQCNSEKDVSERVKNLVEYFNNSRQRIERSGYPEIQKYVSFLHLIKELGDRLNKLNLHEKKIHTFEDDVILKNEVSFEMFKF